MDFRPVPVLYPRREANYFSGGDCRASKSSDLSIFLPVKKSEGEALSLVRFKRLPDVSHDRGVHRA